MKLINVRLPGYIQLQEIIISQGIIQAIYPLVDKKENLDKPESVIDLQGDWLSLGGIDLQINGCLGLAFPDLEKKHLSDLEKICRFLWQQGIDGFLPTIVTTSVTKIQQSLGVIAEFMSNHPQGNVAQILGVHLEGPFLNYQKRGAHPQEYLLPLTIDNVQQVLGEYQEIVKIITLAPELDPTGEVISFLKSTGITISLGHSLATDSEAQIAFQLGASMVTHAFNAMPSLHHRQPGLLGSAIINPSVYCGLIADGQHVCNTMMTLLLRASERVFLVSDALAPLGLDDGIYPWDHRQIYVKNGTAQLVDGTLAGTTFPLLVGVENLAKWGICSVERAISLATDFPRWAISLPSLTIGQKASLLRWHWQLEKSLLTWQRFIY